MRDEGVQQHTLRDPEDYDRYLGGRSESRAFKRMAREDCIRRIGAIPKDARVTEFRLGSNFAVVYAQRMYVIASRLANYDFILKRKKDGHVRDSRSPIDQLMTVQTCRCCEIIIVCIGEH